MSGLEQRDVIVGLDGYKVDTAMQYFYIKGLARGPAMDFIVWRDGKYVEVKAHVPHREFPFSIEQIPK
jgi:S1-C subfamily serine protease